MCTECHRTPCHPMCPNADPPVKVYDCDCCGQEIFVGDDVTSIEQSDETYKRYCEVCIRFMTRPAEED